MKRAAFFFGAGISKASGKPLAPEITQSALRDQWHLGTDKTFYPGPMPSPAFVDSVTPAVQQFLATVNVIARDYIAALSRTPTPREPHYEDLFSLARQAFDSELDETPNLAVVEFLRRLRKETSPLHSRFTNGSSGFIGFGGLASTACDFLHWVVHYKLAANEEPRRGLDAVTQTAKHVDETDIFTLNHDLLIEAQCKEDGIAYEDGFADRRGQLVAFNNWPEETRQKVRLFKLHGSLNWYLYEFPGWARQYAIPDGDPFHSHDQHGNVVNPVEWKPAFLSGTVVKEQYYGIGFFGDIFTAFRRHLARHKHLICCGYGFGDAGINRRIIQWLHDRLDGSNRLVVLTEESETTFFSDKPFELEALKMEGKLILVRKWLENCDLNDLKPYFDN